jgi:arylsulfatase A-like enzyme
LFQKRFRVRDTVILASIWIGAVLLGLSAPEKAAAASGKGMTDPTAPRPNVIIIYCDDLGYGDLGCYGSRAIATPHVDRLAREGVRMTDYYACNGICAPSRAGLLTGRYPFRSGVVGNLYPKDEPFTRKAAREYVGGSLRGWGCWTCGKGRWSPGFPQRNGFWVKP